MKVEENIKSIEIKISKTENTNEHELKQKIIKKGERLPKKHGNWYKINVYDNNFLVLDTWNGYIYHYPNGANPTDTNNLYRVVYTFKDNNGLSDNYTRVKSNMINFWNAHIY